jgi:hypothetical protein
MEMRMRFLGLIRSGVEMRVNAPVILKLYQGARQIEGTHHPYLEICLPWKDISRVICYVSQIKLKLNICRRDITSGRMKALISRWWNGSAVGFTL